MFCPKCGKANQKPETYCRQCGEFLPDFSQKGKKAVQPEDHLKANSFLTLLTAIVSLGLAIALYAFFLGSENTPPVIYLTAGFLVAMCAWQVQIFWRMQLLKKHFKRRQNEATSLTEAHGQTGKFQVAPTQEFLNEADFTSDIPASVIENTTKHLGEKINRQSS